jgi:hypothetical protein
MRNSNRSFAMSIASSRQNYMKFDLPKYGIRESPLHIQKDTPVKIGHSYLVNSTYVR